MKEQPEPGAAGHTDEGLQKMQALLDETRQRGDLAEQELHDRQRQIYHMERVQAIGEIASSLAHELNQPLAGILSNAQAAEHLLDNPEPDLEQIRECVADVIADNRRASSVVDRMRTMLKKEVPAFVLLDVNGVVTEAMALFHMDLVLRGVAMRVELDEGLPQINGDATQLEQVLLNLILNAERAMEDRAEPEREITVRTLADGPDQIVVSVRDTGAGIPAGEAERIFEAFYTSKPDGMGMGLPICRSIITAHGGRIWAEAHPDGGTEVSFILPVKE